MILTLNKHIRHREHNTFSRHRSNGLMGNLCILVHRSWSIGEGSIRYIIVRWKMYFVGTHIFYVICCKLGLLCMLNTNAFPDHNGYPMDKPDSSSHWNMGFILGNISISLKWYYIFDARDNSSIVFYLDQSIWDDNIRYMRIHSKIYYQGNCIS